MVYCVNVYEKRKQRKEWQRWRLTNRQMDKKKKRLTDRLERERKTKRENCRYERIRKNKMKKTGNMSETEKERVNEQGTKKKERERTVPSSPIISLLLSCKGV